MGWLQKAIVLSYFYLLRHVEYLKPENKEQDIYFDSIKYTIKEGGDTDTNAAIVGGMIGALVGFNGIQSYMTDKVIGFDCVNNPMPGSKSSLGGQLGKKRPDMLNTKKWALRNIDKLIELAPEKDIQIITN